MQVPNRHVMANNKYIAEFDITQPSFCLMYWDMNNQYGHGMSQHLPCKFMRWDKTVTLNKIFETTDNSPKGYIVEVNLEFSQHLHIKFDEYPPTPESLDLNTEWYNEFQREIASETY